MLRAERLIATGQSKPARRQAAVCSMAARSTKAVTAIDDGVLLGQRKELRRRNDAVRRMPPAQQGLDAADRPGGEVELGLVFEEELAAVDGALQGFEREPFGVVLDPPQQRAQRVEGERLADRARDVETALDPEAAGRIEHLRAGAAEDDDPGPALVLGQPPQRLDAVQTWHHEVDEDVRGPQGGERLGQAFRIRADGHLVAAALRDPGDERANVRLVVDDQKTVPGHDRNPLPREPLLGSLRSSLQPGRQFVNKTITGS